MTELEENEILEEYNQEFNEKISERKVGNKITCVNCNGNGYVYISLICDYEGIDRKCYTCNGTGYILTTDIISEKKKKCNHCDGVGQILHVYAPMYPGDSEFRTYDSCECCFGSGEIKNFIIKEENEK